MASKSNTSNTLLYVGAAALGAAALGALLYQRRAGRGRGGATAAPRRKPAAAASELGAISPPTDTRSLRSIFEVTTANGFLPLVPAIRKLPAEWADLDELMNRLPELLHADDAEALARAVRALPQKVVPPDAPAVLLQALMRDYSILVSAYLLEGKTKSGAPRTRVPANLSVPFAAVCRRLDEPMIMSYDSYCLSNCYNVRDPAPAADAAGRGDMAKLAARPLASYRDWHWSDLRLVRAFDGGPEEATFILVHAEIESHTCDLIAGYDVLIRGARDRDLPTVMEGLATVKAVMDRIIVSQLKMFNASDPRNYVTFVRPWIFGWRGNPEFPSGVVFEGVSEEPTFLRGETGAQSTIIPSLDVVLGVSHKADKLREMLQQLEEYRPAPQRALLASLRRIMWGEDLGAGVDPAEAHAAGGTGGAGGGSKHGAASTGEPAPVKPLTTALGEPTSAAPHLLRDFVTSTRSVEAVRAFNAVVATVWAFRAIHVTFADVYISRYTDRETATGGTPYKAYLRKHRDESQAHQITALGEAAVVAMPSPPSEVYEAEIDAILRPETVNGIPPHLLARHADIIRRHGGGDASLNKKCFPSTASISKWHTREK